MSTRHDVDAAEAAAPPGDLVDLEPVLAALAAARATTWPWMSWTGRDGALHRERCWRRVVVAELSEVQLPPALVASFATPPPVLPPRRDLSLVVSGVPLACEVLDATPLPGRQWRLRLWAWGPEHARVVA